MILFVLLPVALLLFYACVHGAMHDSGEDGFYFSGMLVPIGLTALWLVWFGVALVRNAVPGPQMKVPGAIALAALVSGLFMNIWRMGGYPEDRALALLYLAPAIAFVVWMGLAAAMNQAMRG